MKTNIVAISALLSCLLFWNSSPAQTFVKLSSSVISGIAGSNDYAGAAWIDFDNDGDQDLCVANSDYLYINDGTGNFTQSARFFTLTASMKGVSWCDYDNDGLPDVFFAGTSNQDAALYKNQGGTFQRISQAPFDQAQTLKGWGVSWGDIDNDSYCDLIIAAPANFGQITSTETNKFVRNNSGSTFFLESSTPITTTPAAYTVPTWYDYDEDGDIDLFIGSGPITPQGAPDWLFENFYVDSAKLSFRRITNSPIGTDNQDGQVWNFVDIDRDGDRDAFISNYGVNFNCKIYENTGGLNFVLADTSKVGKIIEKTGSFLSNSWGDFDNDGDLDVILTRESNASTLYYENDGSGRFTEVSGAFTTPNAYAAISADMDNDGDLDIFLSARSGLSGNNLGLYRNDLSSTNHWIKFRLEGKGAGFSNKSALGAIVEIWSTIGGNHYRQLREVNAQNTFDGMNSLEVHFGLGDAATVDSINVHWPSGAEDKFVSVVSDVDYYLIEGGALQTSIGENSLLQVSLFPNPAKESTLIETPTPIKELKLFDAVGQELLRSNPDSTSYKLELLEFKSGPLFLEISTSQGRAYLQLITL